MSVIWPTGRHGPVGVRGPRPGLSRREWRSLGGRPVVVVGLHLVGWISLAAVVTPAHHALSGEGFGIGLGATAYALGARHAFDADHIAAIDNTTRKFMAEGRRPLSVGFWFSLGHSSVVFVMVMLLAFGIRALAGALQEDDSVLRHVTGLW